MELAQEFKLFQDLGSQDYFREKNLRRYDEFQMNIELSYRLIENQTLYPDRTEKENEEIQIEVERPEVLDQKMKDQYIEWVIKTGFNELFKWVKDILIDYHFIKRIKESDIEINLENFIKYKLEISAKSVAGKKSLISDTVDILGLIPELDTFEKLNCLRNCFEHQNGILTEYYCKPDDFMAISSNRFIVYFDEPTGKKMFCKGNNKSNGSLKMSSEPFILRFNVLEKIKFTLKEFSWLKDFGLLLFLKLSKELFGDDPRPIMSMKIRYRKIRN